MKEIFVSLNGGTAAITHYIPAPARGVVKGLKAVFNKAVANDDTIDIQRGASSVNLLTTGATTAATVYEGTPDETNKDLVFDPASATAAERVLKIVVSALASADTLAGIWIQFDDSAAVDQVPLEA